MAKYVINIVPDVEDILLDSLQEHLFGEVHFKDIYANFGNVRISAVHPFAVLLEQQILSSTVKVSLFPSVTLIENTSNKNPAIPHLVQYKDVVITSAEVADITNNRDKYIMSDADLAALDALTQGTDTVNAKGTSTYLRGNFIAEIWSENLKVKNRLFDVVRNFVLGVWRFKLVEDYDIKLSEDIQGEKSGIYNYDFGKVLYGAILKFDADYVTIQYMADTALGDLTGIIHTEAEVKHSG